MHLKEMLKALEKREELRIPQTSYLLLSTGELNENKNHTVIIEVMKKLLDQRYDVYYIIAGAGGKMQELQKRIDMYHMQNRVKLLGYRSDVQELCNASDIFCFPSHREGLGMAALEAMACGLPLVTSNVHGINDYSIDGVSGYKCNPDDADGFAQAIGRLMDHPEDCRKFGEYNRKQVQNFKTEKAEAAMRRIYMQSVKIAYKGS